MDFAGVQPGAASQGAGEGGEAWRERARRVAKLKPIPAGKAGAGDRFLNCGIFMRILLIKMTWKNDEQCTEKVISGASDGLERCRELINVATFMCCSISKLQISEYVAKARSIASSGEMDQHGAILFGLFDN